MMPFDPGLALVLVGLAFTAIGVLGVIRMPDYMNRFHSSTIISTFGAGFAMLGVAAYAFLGDAPDPAFAKSALIVLAAVAFCGAVSSHALCRACFRRGIIPNNLVKNDHHGAGRKESGPGKGNGGGAR